MGKARAKSLPAHIWDQHKEKLHNLYITKGHTVGRVQDKMAKKGFHARYALARVERGQLMTEKLLANISIGISSKIGNSKRIVQDKGLLFQRRNMELTARSCGEF